MPYKDYQREVEWKKNRYAETRKKIKELKESSPCRDCGNKYPHYIMEFDHVRVDKIKNISAMLYKGFDNVRVQEELNKCDIVCANCHKTRTWDRNQQGAIYDRD